MIQKVSELSRQYQNVLEANRCAKNEFEFTESANEILVYGAQELARALAALEIALLNASL